jgi:glycosyltransferase involved in cell wall biosynthesis
MGTDVATTSSLNPTMRIAILTPSFTTRDAVSHDVLGMHETLRRMGEVRIFAEGWTVKSPSISSYDRIGSFVKERNDIVIYHHSRGWEPALDLWPQLTCRKILRYHNITPPDFFTRYNQNMASTCLAGRQEIKALVAGCDLFLGTSGYTAGELIAEGADESRCFVVPPFHRANELSAINSDATVLTRLQNGNVNLCTVGRIAPNKGHVDLLAAFAVYHHDYNNQSKLSIVGKRETRLANYMAVLQATAIRLNVDHAVTFTGDVSEAVLKAQYNASDIFVTTTEHEGFCVPLVEAMVLGVPIVAYSTPAVTETIGKAGIVWKQRNPVLLAESVSAVIADQSLRNRLKVAGQRRYEECFAPQRIAARLNQVLNAF